MTNIESVLSTFKSNGFDVLNWQTLGATNEWQVTATRGEHGGLFTISQWAPDNTALAEALKDFPRVKENS